MYVCDRKEENGNVSWPRGSSILDRNVARGCRDRGWVLEEKFQIPVLSRRQPASASDMAVPLRKRSFVCTPQNFMVPDQPLVHQPGGFLNLGMGESIHILFETDSRGRAILYEGLSPVYQK